MQRLAEEGEGGRWCENACIEDYYLEGLVQVLRGCLHRAHRSCGSVIHSKPSLRFGNSLNDHHDDREKARRQLRTFVVAALPELVRLLFELVIPDSVRERLLIRSWQPMALR